MNRLQFLRRRWLLWTAIALVPLLALSAVLVVNRDDGETAAPTTTTTTTTTTTAPPPPPPPPPPPTAPLTGLPDSSPPHAALAVKIDNVERARPPIGLTLADVVFEEMVEGGLTRLLSVFHTRDPEPVGPVRSARTTDLSLLAELGRPLFSWSGANAVFTEAVLAANLVNVGPGAAGDAYYRDGDRRAPSNLFASAAGLRGAGASLDPAASATNPPVLFTYRPGGTPPDPAPNAVPAWGYDTALGSGSPLRTSIRWDWDPNTGVYARSQSGTPHADADGVQVGAVNVIVRYTDYIDSGFVDTSGAMVPEAVTVGQGDMVLLSGGQAIPGLWHKPAFEAPTTYTTLDGTPLRLAPGNTWVELLPPGSGSNF